MRPVSVVVVDLPLVPVIATMRPVSHREASSISPMIGHAGLARGDNRAADPAARPGSARSDRPIVNVSEPMPAQLERDTRLAQLRRRGAHRQLGASRR